MSKIALNIFISSKGSEFKSHRFIIAEAIKSLSMNPIFYEEYGAENQGMDISNEEDVKRCNLFVGIYGKEYSKPTETEFDIAIIEKKPCLLYIDNNHSKQPLSSEMIALIDKVKQSNRIYRLFTTIIDLRNYILQDIQSELARSHLFKYQRANDIIKNKIEESIQLIDDYKEYQDYIERHFPNVRINKVIDEDGEIKILINHGVNHGLFSNIDFSMKYEREVLSRIRIEQIQDEFSVCTLLGEITSSKLDTLRQHYADCALLHTELSLKDFVFTMMEDR